MSILIVTTFAKEFQAVKELVKFPTEFKIEKLKIIEGEISRKKIALICAGQGRLSLVESLNSYFNKNSVQQAFLVGYCGALVPDIRVGDIFSPVEFYLDPKIQVRPTILNPVPASLRTAKIVTVDVPATTKSEKEQLNRETMAELVDMESYAFADFMFAQKVPYVVIRVVLDDLFTVISDYKELESNANLSNRSIQMGLLNLLGENK